MEIVLIITVLIVVGIMALASIISATRLRLLQEAKTAYQAALGQLTSNPTDNSLRIAALDAGRHYADLARKATGSGGRAIFDEVALSNDLNARTGVAPSVSIAAASSTSAETKKCPQCAELVKLDARICRFCQTKFETAA